MKKLDLIIRLLHFIAVVGTYAAVLELILKAIRAVMSLFR